MDDQQQSRWRPTRGQLLWAVGIAAVTFVGIVICGYLFGWNWTGLPKRTLWDWLSLLIVPAVLALGGYLFTRTETQRTLQSTQRQRDLDRELATKQTETDREIADQRRQDDMLQAYLDGMSQLLTDKDRPLHRAQVGDSLSTVARARTLTVLTRLDGERKRSVLQFLHESGLLGKRRVVFGRRPGGRVVFGRSPPVSRGVVDLGGADLRKADLREAVLIDAKLSGVDLREADLRGATLGGTDLREADLRKADLREAVLSQADLRAVYLSQAKMRKANLSEANLDVAYLSEADVRDVDLRGATLRGADLRGADLRGAYLSEAALIEAYDLREAKLREAKLSEARGIFNEELAQQTSLLEGATMPNGQKYEDWLKSGGHGNDRKNNDPS